MIKIIIKKNNCIHGINNIEILLYRIQVAGYKTFILAIIWEISAILKISIQYGNIFGHYITI